jgi:hypothetical protein
MTVDSHEVSRAPLKAWRLTPQLEADVLLPCSIVTYSKAIQPEHTRIRITNGFREWTNGVTLENAQAEVCVFVQSECTTPSPVHLSDFCDLSAKEGLRGTHQGVRRVLSQLRAFDFLAKETEWEGSQSEWNAQLQLPFESDRDLLMAAREL